MAIRGMVVVKNLLDRQKALEKDKMNASSPSASFATTHMGEGS